QHHTPDGPNEGGQDNPINNYDIDGTDCTTSESHGWGYYVRHVSHPVAFAKCLATAVRDDGRGGNGFFMQLVIYADLGSLTGSRAPGARVPDAAPANLYRQIALQNA